MRQTMSPGPSPSASLLCARAPNEPLAPSVAKRKPTGGPISKASRFRWLAHKLGWRGCPMPKGAEADPLAVAAYARGLRRRRKAIELRVWYPRQGQSPVSLEERRLSRAAVKAAIAAEDAVLAGQERRSKRKRWIDDRHDFPKNSTSASPDDPTS